MTLAEALNSIETHPIFPTPYEEYKKLDGLEHIYPTKQRMVYRLFKAFENDNRIKEIIIFGSSTSIYVDRHSDLDVAIKLADDNWDEQDPYLNEIAKTISKITNGNFDLLFLNDPDINGNKRLMSEIVDKGVRICAK